jgi:hypothetical protein
MVSDAVSASDAYDTNNYTYVPYHTILASSSQSVQYYILYSTVKQEARQGVQYSTVQYSTVQYTISTTVP